MMGFERVPRGHIPVCHTAWRSNHSATGDGYLSLPFTLPSNLSFPFRPTIQFVFPLWTVLLEDVQNLAIPKREQHIEMGWIPDTCYLHENPATSPWRRDHMLGVEYAECFPSISSHTSCQSSKTTY